MADHLDEHEQFRPAPHAEVRLNWLNDYFRQISADLNNLFYNRINEPRHIAPDRKFDGLTEFADGTDWNPGDGRGMYYWDSDAGASGEWIFMG
jgi:hypothetical protein